MPSIKSALKLHEKGDDEKAVEICLRLLKETPDAIDPYILRAVIFEKAKDHANAALEFGHALRVRPRFEYEGFSNALGFTYGQLAERMKSNAVSAMERQYRGNVTKGLLVRLMPLLGLAEHTLGNLAAAEQLYRHCMSQGFDPYLCLTGFTLVRQQLGDMASYRKLVDYSAFPVTFDIGAERGGRKIAKWNKSIFDTIVGHPSLVPEIHVEAAKAKYITATFTKDTAPGPVAQLADLIAEKVDMLRDGLTPISGHPFFGKIPKQYRIEIFGALLDPGGHHSPHVHTDSWVSGAYYARVPDLSNDKRTNTGCLEFGKFIVVLGDDFVGERHYLKPREGLMAIWPSYYIHNTVPCLDSRQRLTMGFNVYTADQPGSRSVY